MSLPLSVRRPPNHGRSNPTFVPLIRSDLRVMSGCRSFPQIPKGTLLTATPRLYFLELLLHMVHLFFKK